MTENKNLEELKNASRSIRNNVIKMTYYAGGYGAHIGGSLSLVEILSVLYGNILNYQKFNLANEIRDRLILSKGHGGLALYAAFREFGLITQEELDSFRKSGSWLTAHPTMDITKGIEFSSGSLGQGLGQGIGTAVALKLKKNDSSKVYVILGDGECDEGSVWEGVMSAPQLKLNNLIVIVDKNNLQCDDKTDNILSLKNLSKAWEDLGWQVSVVNGHSEEQLLSALQKRNDKPYVIVANTVKGKGVSFIENNPKWHMGRLSKSQYIEAMKEQGVTVEL